MSGKFILNRSVLRLFPAVPTSFFISLVIVLLQPNFHEEIILLATYLSLKRLLTGRRMIQISIHKRLCTFNKPLIIYLNVLCGHFA